jgi:uncharacterized protein YrrD
VTTLAQQERNTMLRLNQVLDTRVDTADGELGMIEDALIDFEDGTVRYLVLDASSWLNGYRLLLAPQSLESIGPDGRQVANGLSRTEVLEGIAAIDAPGTLLGLEDRLRHYCGQAGRWMAGTYPYGWGLITPSDAPRVDGPLRSFKSIRGYAVAGLRQRIGRVHDALVNQETWQVRFIDIRTGRSLEAGRALLAATDIDGINDAEMVVFSPLSATQICQVVPFLPRPG